MRFVGCIAVMLMCSMGAVGCKSAAVGGVIDRNATRSDTFVNRMEAGATTRAQEQDFIRANRRALHVLNYHHNDKPLPPDVQAWVDEHLEEEE